jgi:hypothetical protein
MFYVVHTVCLLLGGQVERLGPMHQAGSDSLLTAKTFFTFVDKHMGGDNWDEKRYVRVGPIYV